jgi:hypothetical protein
MDSLVAKALEDAAGLGVLPKWKGVKHLTPEANRIYQEFAAALAKARGIQRIDLDSFLWVEGR